ncbi:SpoIIE family protein phosphatase [Silvibacterium acidisoli]|uniref:SpoIIE family protein phosphatase n=1 Tax=Acidobacteriaceae bacterium ZG23-2 TaxID=2883246 RepID=UPI00406C0D83
MKTRNPSPNLLRALLAVYVLASFSFWLTGVIDMWDGDLHWNRHIQAPFSCDDDSLKIDEVRPEAKSAGLATGFRVTGLNGAPNTGKSQWAEIVSEEHPGDTLDVEFVRPDGSSGMATVTLVTKRRSPSGISVWAVRSQRFLMSSLLPLICLLIGYWVVFSKPLLRNAWLLLVLLTAPSVIWVNIGYATGLGLALRAFWYNLLQMAIAPALMFFGVYFPERSRIDQRLPWIKWLVVGPILIGAVALFPLLYLEYFAAPPNPAFAGICQQIEKMINALNLACVILYLIFTLDKLRSASTEDARRRLRVLTTGMFIGVGSLLFVFVLLPHFGIDNSDRPVDFWIRTAGSILFTIAPFTLAYVVLVQRAMDVRVIVRTGTRYLLAKAFLYVVQSALIFLATWLLLLPIFSKKQSTASDVAAGAVFLMLVVGLRLGLAKRAQDWIDRRFFREAYNAEVVLNELSDEVRRFTETAPLLETVVRRVAETLHVDQVAMLLRRGEFFHLQQSIGVSFGSNGTAMLNAGALVLPAQASAVRYLASTNEPARLYRDDPDAWYLMAGMSERQFLDTINAELLLPLPGRNRLMGVMALGPKRSEAAYTQADLHMLQTVATQTGLAIEISELARSLATEAAQRERVNREIEIAREVQERLFPQEMPQLPGATIAGACRPALGVGGDYYDVFELTDGRTGLAIGDVSGKGIAAALLMASLRASLRGVTLDNPRDFANLMDKVNRLVYEASASNRYATFFFAAYDPKTRQLDCVNAGHNPPIILRRRADGGQDAIRLEAGGPVVGLLPVAPYTEESIVLEPGDVLLLYTDGISEAMTHEDEEWGEDRLIEAASRVRERPATEILVSIFEAADRFTAGAPQHDDMTLLVLKLDD